MAWTGPSIGRRGRSWFTTADCWAAAEPVRPRSRLAFGWRRGRIIHTVGPVWRGGAHHEAELLASCYRASLARADEVGAAVVAFPAISTGIFGYPSVLAAEVAVGSVRSASTSVHEVRFVCFDASSENAYREVLQ